MFQYYYWILTGIIYAYIPQEKNMEKNSLKKSVLVYLFKYKH